MKWLILFLGIGCNASASILIKVAMDSSRKLPNIPSLVALLYNWPLLIGIVLYGCAFILYAVALMYLPLSIVQPVLTSGAIAVVSILAFYIFKEPFNTTTVFGIVFIILGVIFISYKAI